MSSEEISLSSGVVAPIDLFNYELLESKSNPDEVFSREIKVKVAGDFYRSELERQLEIVATRDNVRLKGFAHADRPPKELVKAVVLDDVKNAVVRDIVVRAVDDFCKSSNMKRADQDIRYRVDAYEPDLIVRIALNVGCDVALPDMSAVNIPLYICKVTDGDLDERCARVMEESNFPVESDEAIAVGDKIIIENRAFISGTDKQVKPMCGRFRIDAKGSDNEVEKAIIGLRAGDTTVVKIHVPNDYAAKSFRGREVDINVTVLKVNKSVRASDMDDFFKRLNISRERLYMQLESDLKEQVTHYTSELHRDAVKNAFLAASDFEPPAEVVSEYLSKLAGEAREKTTHEDAVKTTKLMLLISEYASAKSIELTQQDLHEPMRGILNGDDDHDKKVIQFYRNNPKASDGLKARMLVIKVLDNMLSEVQRTEKQVSYQELLVLYKGLSGIEEYSVDESSNDADSVDNGGELL